MMFQADTAFASELLALVAGTFLLAWVGKQEVCCKSFVKTVAYFTIVASILGMLCTGYYTLRYWNDGHFKMPHTMMSMPGAGGMQDMRTNCPMMKQKMEGGKGMNKMDQKDMPQNNSEAHSEHH